MRKRISLAIYASILGLLLLTVTPAFAVNLLSTDPAVILLNSKTTITLTTERSATGTLTVTDPNGNSFTQPINIPGAAGGTQTWTFPDDFPGADTATLGSYDVVADVTMPVGPFTWKTKFMVEFFVIPDLPFGAIMAIVAGFAAFGATKIKHRKIITA